MATYIIPLAIIVISNAVYQICSKSIPGDIEPFSALTVTYLVAAISTLVLHFAIGGGEGLIKEYGKLNWAPFILGLSIVGLEGGFVFAYKAGWQISTLSTVQGAILAVVLVAVGFVLYREALTANKIIGVVVCLVGLYFLNK